MSKKELLEMLIEILSSALQKVEDLEAEANEFNKANPEKNYICKQCGKEVLSRFPISCKKCSGMPMMKVTRKKVK